MKVDRFLMSTRRYLRAASVPYRRTVRQREEMRRRLLVPATALLRRR